MFLFFYLLLVLFWGRVFVDRMLLVFSFEFLSLLLMAFLPTFLYVAIVFCLAIYCLFYFSLMSFMANFGLVCIFPLSINHYLKKICTTNQCLRAFLLESF